VAKNLSQSIISMDEDKSGTLDWGEIWKAMEMYYHANLKAKHGHRKH